MKTMKVALLASAALAAVSVSARADDTAAIKAQLEALTARIAQLETAPAVPVGYSLLTISEGPATMVPGLDNLTPDDPTFGDKATIIGIMPAADVPAETTLEWSGFVRAIVAHTDYSYAGGDEETNVWTRARLRVVGKTDTAVGEVGARMSFEANAERVDEDPSWAAVEYWGWWAMTPEIAFGGGYSGSLGNVAHGFDGSCDPCAGIDWFSAEQRDEDHITFSANPGDTAQVRLSWASGPLSMGIALEDSDYDNTGNAGDLGVAGKIGYAGDTFSVELAGIVYEHDDGSNAVPAVLGDDPSTSGVETTFVLTPAVADTSSDDGEGWQIAAGVGFGLTEMAKVSVSAAIGEEPSKGDYWNASAFLGLSLTDTVSAQFGASYADYDDLGLELTEFDVGLYYNPVDQLTIGVEAAWADGMKDFYSAGADEDFTTFDFVSIWRF